VNPVHDGAGAADEVPAPSPALPLKVDTARSMFSLEQVGQVMPFESAPIFWRRAKVLEQSLQMYS